MGNQFEERLVAAIIGYYRNSEGELPSRVVLSFDGLQRLRVESMDQFGRLDMRMPEGPHYYMGVEINADRNLSVDEIVVEGDACTAL